MIAIPNMEIPKNCVKCHWYYECYDEHCTLGKFLLRKYPIDVSEEPYILNTQRHPDCPLIEIDENNPMLLEFLNEFDKWRAYKELIDSIRMAQKERRSE